jgi:predicted nucleotidyltransferase
MTDRYIYISVAIIIYHMLQGYSRYRLLEEFFDYPRKGFHIRELSRRIQLAQISVQNHLKALQKEGLILKTQDGIYPTYKANRDDPGYRLLKQHNLAWRIHTSGLLTHLEEKLRPDCIVLFGSGARGEDTETSDIDLLIQAEETELELDKYEQALNRKINPLFEPHPARLGKELLNNIINGHVLHGYLEAI